MQTSYRSLLEQVFHEDCPVEWQIGMLHTLNLAYEMTREHCRPPNFGPNEARDLRGHHIRAKFETEWRRLASSLPGIDGESRPNSKKSQYHTWVKVGRLFMTASSVQTKSQKKLRNADFRSEYSDNGQLSCLETQPCTDESVVYAIFRYGPLQSEVPSIATVSFPNKSLTGYTEHIDLAALYPGVIRSPGFEDVEEQEEPMPTDIRETPGEIIPEPGAPPLRHQRPTASGEESK